MRKSALAGIAAIALLGALVAAIPLIEKAVASRIKAEIERDGTTTVGQVEVGILARRVVLDDLKSSQAAGLSIGHWEASGLGWPVAELLRGRTPLAGFRLGAPLKAERVDLRHLRLGDRGGAGTWTIDSLVLEGVDLASFDASEEGPYRGSVVLARALGALAFRRLEQNGTNFAMPLGGDTIGMSTLAVERYEGGRMAVVRIVRFEAASGTARLPLYQVADVDIRDLDIRRTLTSLSSVDWRPDAPIGRIGIESMRASGFGGDMLTRFGATLGSISIENVVEGDGVTRSRARIDGFTLAPPLRNLEALKLRLALQAMGLRELKLGFDCSGTEDRGRGEITLDRCTLSGPELADINLMGRVTGADESFWHAVDEGDSVALYDTKAVLLSGRLVLADHGLLERGLKAFAATTGQQVSAVRTNLARDIRRLQPAGVLITQGLTQLLETSARFVEQGGTLTFDARPEPPLAIGRIDYLTSPGADLVNALGLTATLSR